MVRRDKPEFSSETQELRRVEGLNQGGEPPPLPSLLLQLLGVGPSLHASPR